MTKTATSPTKSKAPAKAKTATKKAKATSKSQLLGVINQLAPLHDGKPPRDLVAQRAGYGDGNNGSFKKALFRASKRGQVDLSDKSAVFLTEKGQQEAGDVPELPTNKEAQEAILEELTSKRKEAFELLNDGKVYLRSDIAAKLGYESEKHQGFKKLLDRIKAMGYLDYPDKDSVQLSDTCFPNGRDAE